MDFSKSTKIVEEELINASSYFTLDTSSPYFYLLLGVFLLLGVWTIAGILYLRFVDQEIKTIRVVKEPPTALRSRGSSMPKKEIFVSADSVHMHVVNSNGSSPNDQQFVKRQETLINSEVEEQKVVNIQEESKVEPAEEIEEKIENPKLAKRTIAPKKPISPAEKATEIANYTSEGISTINLFKKRINSLEMVMGARMYLANRLVNEALIKSRRVVRAVEQRLQALERILLSPTVEGIESGFQLMETKISIQKDTMNDLLDSAPIQPIDPHSWQEMLEEIICGAEEDVKIAINQ